MFDSLSAFQDQGLLYLGSISSMPYLYFWKSS